MFSDIVLEIDRTTTLYNYNPELMEEEGRGGHEGYLCGRLPIQTAVCCLPPVASVQQGVRQGRGKKGEVHRGPLGGTAWGRSSLLLWVEEQERRPIDSVPP